MDSRVLHCGGANTQRERLLFYVSFKRRDYVPTLRVSSLRDDLRGRCLLRPPDPSASSSAAAEATAAAGRARGDDCDEEWLRPQPESRTAGVQVEVLSH